MSVERLRRLAAGPNRVYWYCLIGVIVWATLRQLGVDPNGPRVRFGAFLLVMALIGANLLARQWHQSRRAEHRALHPYLPWLFVAADFLLIVAALRLTGGLASPLWVATFVVVSGETVLERMREATITRLSACVALFLGTVPLPGQGDVARLDWPAYCLEMFVRMGLVIAVSSVIRRLRERNDTDKMEVASLRAELARSEERGRLSREIHDGVGNSLAAGVLRLEAAARIREKQAGADETVAMLKEEAAALRECMSGVRDWTFQTRPWRAEGGTSASALLLSETERLARRTGLPIVVHGASALDSLPESSRLAVLRIAQEGLTNAAKHASGATQVTLALATGREGFTLEIADDGPGIPTDSAGAGVGLASMRERAEGAGGTLTLERVEPHGTLVRLWLPPR